MKRLPAIIAAPVLAAGVFAGALFSPRLCAQTQVRPRLALPSYKDLKFPPLPAIQPPVPASVTLPNGMRIFLLEDHELPVVSGFALIRTGNLFDPADKRGLAELTGEVLRAGGTKTRTGDQIDRQLENVAASVESNIGESYGTVSFSCLKENTAQVLDTFEDLLTAPEFREDKVDLAKTQLRSGISRRNDDAGGIAGREFQNLVYGRDTPYGWMIEYADVENIRRQDLLDFYRRYYFPSNVMLAVYGDFSAAEMKDRLAKLFAGWDAKQPPVPKFPELGKAPGKGMFLAAKTDVTQTFFEVGHLGGVLNDKDYPALEVAAEILGGGFSSRLFERIRTQLGYAYNVGAAWGANYDHPGLFRIAGSTQSAHTVDTLKAVREELDRIRTAPVGDPELQTAKDTILNSFVFNFDRPSKTLNRLMVYEYFGYPKDFVFQYQKAIAAVTKADVLRVAKKYFQPQDLTIVAVGNPQDFKTPLASLGLPVQDLDLAIPEPKQAAAKTDAASREQGRQLLAKVQQALGGAARLAAIKDVVFQAEVDLQPPGGPPIKVKQRNSFIAPDPARPAPLRPAHLREDLELPFGKQSVYSNGSSGWISGPQGAQNAPPQVLKQAQGELFRKLFALVLSDHNPDRTVSYAGAGALDISDPSGEAARLQVDEKTGLPARLSYRGNALGGPPTEVEEIYSDWRDVDGIRAPFQWTILQGGAKLAAVTVGEYKINSGLKPEDLSKQP